MIQTFKKRRRAAGGLLWLPVDEIAANPMQPRRSFDEQALRELADSIARYGVINPLTVRQRGEVFELVAGERRLRAAKLAGLREVPCLTVEAGLEESGLLALVENLQRRDLDFLEEAEGIETLIRLFGLSQEEAARRLGRSQPAVANKLRILKLPADVREGLLRAGLGERHGRALLRLPDETLQRQALQRMAREGMTVAAAEAMVDAMLASRAAPPGSGRRTVFVLKDVRLFLNTVTQGVDLMRRGGIDARVRREETDEMLELVISIPKDAPAARR